MNTETKPIEFEALALYGYKYFYLLNGDKTSYTIIAGTQEAFDATLFLPLPEKPDRSGMPRVSAGGVIKKRGKYRVDLTIIGKNEPLVLNTHGVILTANKLDNGKTFYQISGTDITIGAMNEFARYLSLGASNTGKKRYIYS